MKKTERPIITFPNGQTVCPLGQGTWKMGQSAARRHEEIRALQHGIELGMNLVDTAEMYDNEELVGEAVRDCREKVLLVSKVLPSNASYRGTKLACERSLLKLGTEYIDLYLLHWKGRHPYEETVRAMTELQQEGKIRLWGVSNMDTADMERIVSLSGGSGCATDQVLYNLGDRGIEFDLMPWCAARRMPLMAYSPIGEGRISHKRHCRGRWEKDDFCATLHWWKSPGDTMYRLHKSHCRGRCVSPVSLPYPKPVM